jgi:hypothetical protein
MKTEFTLERALSIQDSDLRWWSIILKEDVYKEVHRIVKGRNEGITNPFQICRGSDISTIVLNISLGNLELNNINNEK